MHEKANIAVDPVIFTISENKLKVLLQKREKEPFKGKYELLGGLIETNETAEDALERKLSEVLGAGKVFFEQFYTFTNPKRDPRVRTASIGFLALIEKSKIKSTENWFDADNLPMLAFDHREIINKALEYLKNNLDSELVKQFLPQKFPLNELQKIHEIILEEIFDNRNFRKKMRTSEVIKETKELEKNVSHRPAILYKFS
ncbi:NUDIX hydrolase [Candidatus Woesearchaeota archaeon]|nr:NUDIX hydrolase [Candidatus Woesearchaeota archaeon]